METGSDSLPIVVEEEKHGSERIHSCIPFLGGAMPVPAFMPCTKGRMAHSLWLASWKTGTPASFEAYSEEYTHQRGGFSWRYSFEDAALPKAGAT
jgi:hypothetical protein